MMQLLEPVYRPMMLLHHSTYVAQPRPAPLAHPPSMWFLSLAGASWGS